MNIRLLASLKQFSALSPKVQAYLLSDPKMSPEKLSTVKDHLGLTSKDVMKYVDYAVDSAALAKQVAAAAIALHNDLMS